MKRYYRQKKTSERLGKSKSKHFKKKSSKSAAVTLDPQDDYDANEKLLREFDMNMAYGPCVGISRLDRWKRAEAFGLNPPKEVENLLKSDLARQDCLWTNLK